MIIPKGKEKKRKKEESKQARKTERKQERKEARKVERKKERNMINEYIEAGSQADNSSPAYIDVHVCFHHVVNTSGTRKCGG